MCLLIYMPPQTTVKEADIYLAAEQNPDGFGWAVMTPFTILRGHSMDIKEAAEGFYKARQTFPDMDALFHLRIATAGTVDIDNCHPFLVGGDHRTVLAHNGILPIKGDHRSDTRIFAEEWLPQLGITEWLDDEDKFGDLQTFAAGSKVLVLSVDPELHKYAYLLNEDDGHWVGGIWFSNFSYTEDYGFYGGWNTGTWTEDADGNWRRYEPRRITRGWNWDIRPENGYRFSNEELQDLYGRGYETIPCQICDSDWVFDPACPEDMPDECLMCGACMSCGSFGCGAPGECQTIRAELSMPADPHISSLPDGSYAEWHSQYVDELPMLDEQDDDEIYAEWLATKHEHVDAELFAQLDADTHNNTTTNKELTQ